jgi:hypothetical protein
MLSVYVNGVVQSVREYTATSDHIIFPTAPSAGSTVTIQSRFHIIETKCNGIQATFDIGGDSRADEYNRFRGLTDQIWKHKDNPAVAEAMNRLNVLIALIDE